MTSADSAEALVQATWKGEDRSAQKTGQQSSSSSAAGLWSSRSDITPNRTVLAKTAPVRVGIKSQKYRKCDQIVERKHKSTKTRDIDLDGESDDQLPTQMSSLAEADKSKSSSAKRRTRSQTPVLSGGKMRPQKKVVGVVAASKEARNLQPVSDSSAESEGSEGIIDSESSSGLTNDESELFDDQSASDASAPSSDSENDHSDDDVDRDQNYFRPVPQDEQEDVDNLRSKFKSKLATKPTGVNAYEEFCAKKKILKKDRYPIQTGIIERFASWLRKKGTLSPTSMCQYLAVVKSYSCEVSGIGLSK